ncbi:MAG TPA: hypothetical protein VH352_20635 [Pseudonocardiaceae bacterium]|jgi:hypothetical protein|nr:hypothetical protein [Pseudonocardiaceae bacterium]
MNSTVLRIARRAAVPVAAIFAVVGLAGTAGAVIDPAPIGPNQFFTGIVNGASVNATITTNCIGPIRPGETGNPLPNQYVEVSPGPSSGNVGIGFTGSNGNSVIVVLNTGGPTGPIQTVLIGTLHDYIVHLPIPTGITVPCAGPGDVAFVPSPGSSNAKSAIVNVNLVFLGL